MSKSGLAPELDAIYVYELLLLRPAILKVLAIDPGNLVVMKDDEIEAILNCENVDIWSAARAEGKLL